MNYQEYKTLFDDIISSEDPELPYDNPQYMEYTKLNYSRMKRWDKNMKLDEELVERLQNLKQKQHWIIIVEPWCGDAAHILPFLVRLAEQSEQISYELQLRDSKPYLIESYLTNGGKSIPKLIVRDENGRDLFTWGPRPHGAQEVVTKMKAANAEFETMKIELQKWYNEDKGGAVFRELLAHYQQLAPSAGTAQE